MNSAASRHPLTPPIPDTGSPVRIARDLLYQIQCDRLHRRPAVAAMRRKPAHVRARRERVQIDPRNRVDGVDGGQPSAPRVCSARNHADIGDVRVSLTSTGVRAPPSPIR